MTDLSSFFQSAGLTITLTRPVVQGLSNFEVHVEDRVTAYSHEISVDGGFKTAKMSFAADPTEIDFWMDEALAMDVKVYSPYLDLVWEGYIDSVSSTSGTASGSIGPLREIANRVVVMYSPVIDPTHDPPIVGSEQETPAVEDTDSQARYGIWEKILSAGQALAEAVEEARDTYLRERAYPETSDRKFTTSLAPGSITLECEGYDAWLSAYPYNDATALTQQVSAKVKAVLSADPNAIISSDHTNIADVLTLVSRYENENRYASDVIKSLIALGDGSLNRVLFQIMERRTPYLYPIPSGTEYFHRLSDEGLVIENSVGNIVYPWDVRPGKWIFIPDYMVGRIRPGGVKREDPRFVFIESVTYTAPWGLEVNGSKVETVPQLLAQYGLGGMS